MQATQVALPSFKQSTSFGKELPGGTAYRAGFNSRKGGHQLPIFKVNNLKRPQRWPGAGSPSSTADVFFVVE